MGITTVRGLGDGDFAEVEIPAEIAPDPMAHLLVLGPPITARRGPLLVSVVR